MEIKYQISTVLLMSALAGCSGMSQLQAPIEKFNQGAHTAATNEMVFLKAIETVDCNSQFYKNAHDWAMCTTKTLCTTQTFDISGVCKPTILTDKQLKIRQGLMDAITLYADKMLALASTDNNKTLDISSQKLASNLNSFAKLGGFSSISAAADIETAIIAISEMALDQKRFTAIKTAAASMSPYLKTVVTALKLENTSFVLGYADKLDSVESKLRDIIVNAHEQRGPMGFFDVVEARHLMQSINPLGTAADQQHLVTQLNATLDAIVKTNQAIAESNTGGIKASVNDLIARATAAQADQSALAKK